MENNSQNEGKDPSSFLSEIIGSAVIVKLNSGVVYKGTFTWDLGLYLDCTGARIGANGSCWGIGELQSVDGYMNIALEKTQEFVNGTKRREYGDTFVRGNNGESLQQP